MPVGGERVEHRQIEGERLPRSRARRDDHVAAGLRGCVRIGLVRVELVDAAAGERFPQGRLEGAWKRGGSRLTRGLGREVRELVADEEIAPLGDADAHRQRSAIAIG